MRQYKCWAVIPNQPYVSVHVFLDTVFVVAAVWGGQGGLHLVTASFWLDTIHFNKKLMTDKLPSREKYNLEIIDITLGYLFNKFHESTDFNSKPTFSKTLSDLKEILPNFDRDELELILDKLRKDGYINFSEFGSSSTMHQMDTRYIITFEGKMFHEQAGYMQQKINADAENIRVEKLEISQQTLMGKLNVVTAWIAGGTIALVLVELWKMALEHHWFSCH